MSDTKFHGAKNWRRRQRLDKKLTALVESVGCLEHIREHQLFDAGNFEFSLRQAQLELAQLNDFYWRNK